MIIVTISIIILKIIIIIITNINLYFNNDNIKK